MKTVLITGATRNTGLAIARRFAGQGYAVAITSRDGIAAKNAAEALEKEFSVQLVQNSLLVDRGSENSYMAFCKQDSTPRCRNL